MRGKMYNYDEDTNGYDYIDDGGESEARKEWIPAEIEEFSKCEDNESFIESVKNHNRKYGIRKLPSEPKSEPKDFADGLREFIESKAGRPISELNDKNGREEDVNAKQLFEEIEAERDKIIAEEFNNPEYWEKAKKDAIESYSRIPMFDFGLGQMSNEYEMSEFYGLDLLNRIRKEIRESCNLPDHIRETGQISKELWQELKDIRAGEKSLPKSTNKGKSTEKRPADPQKNADKTSEPTKKEKKEPKKIEITQRERQPGDDYYMITERGVIRNRSYRELFQGPGTVYEWIWANLVRGEWIDTKGYPIKEKYYDKGFLAYCSSYRKIAKDCGLHKNKVKEYIDNFKNAGIIKVEHLIPERKKQGQSVFILGEWKMIDGERHEFFYKDKIFLTSKSGQNKTT